MEIKEIARIRSDLTGKFGVPRQSGLADVPADIIFEPGFASHEAIRGLADFSYIWLIWGFSENAGKGWHQTVRPPRLGGNTRIGVYATRSPFRPNPLGLSSVKLTGTGEENGVPVLHVLGADLMNGTPIYDIKPYISYADCHPDAAGGFTSGLSDAGLEVIYDEKCGSERLPHEKRAELTQILSLDPRPSYQHDPDRVYGLSFAGHEVKFRVQDGTLTVLQIQ